MTGDRLRHRVLGTSDADAAAKTLFNTVGAARRLLGRDGAGRPLLPPASRAGQYEMAAEVTLDAARLVALTAAADAAASTEEAMALLRAALSLVDGEPLAGILSGYAWWRGEGHEQRLAGTAVDAACALARLASAAGAHDLARWGVAQARLVDPYSETLARVAMVAAARGGDGARLRREWLECQRRVEELDPGTAPSASTEHLYQQLRRELAAPSERGQASLAAMAPAPRSTVPSAPAEV